MCGESNWDGEPYVEPAGVENDFPSLIVMRIADDGRRHQTVIFHGHLAGYRAGTCEGTMVLYAGGEITIQANNYMKARETILNWVRSL